MRDVGDKVAIGREQLLGPGPGGDFGCQRGFQAVGHAIERGAEVGDLVLAVDLDSHAHVARRQQPGRAGRIP